MLTEAELDRIYLEREQAAERDEDQTEADSGRPYVCVACGYLDCVCQQNWYKELRSQKINRFEKINNGICPDCEGGLTDDGYCQPCHIIPALDPAFQQWIRAKNDQPIIFDAEGVTLVIDGQPLKANVSYSDAVAWRSLLKRLFPNADIEPVWTRVF